MVRGGINLEKGSPELPERFQKIVDHAHQAREESARIHHQVDELKNLYQQQLKKIPARFPDHR